MQLLISFTDLISSNSLPFAPLTLPSDESNKSTLMALILAYISVDCHVITVILQSAFQQQLCFLS